MGARKRVGIVLSYRPPQSRKLKSRFVARNQFQAVRQPYMPTWFLAPIAGLKLPTQATVHRLAESIPWNRFLGSLKVVPARLSGCSVMLCNIIHCRSFPIPRFIFIRTRMCCRVSYASYKCTGQYSNFTGYSVTLQSAGSVQNRKTLKYRVKALVVPVCVCGGGGGMQ
jgi:hypothetical protein